MKFRRRSSSAVIVMALCVTALVLGARHADALAGDLDPSFDGDGQVTTDFGGVDSAEGLALQRDGMVVAAGTSQGDFALARYNADGSLDEQFGSSGRTITDLGASEQVGGIALDDDEKIIVAGSSGLDFAVARYEADGSLDPTFGENGKVLTVVEDGGFAQDLALQSDGKIVVAGLASAPDPVDNRLHFAVVRYESDGSLDAAFGDDGVVVTPVRSIDDEAYAIAVQPDEKIVVAGLSYATQDDSNNPRDPDFALVRYNPDGSLDTSFDGDGKVVTVVSSQGTSSDGRDGIFDLLVLPDGDIIATGESEPSFSEFALARYNPDGSLDAGFGSGGIVSTQVGLNSKAFAVVRQNDGNLVVAGQAREQSHPDLDFAVARYEPDGALDNSFSGDGKLLTSFTSGHDVGRDIVLRGDNTIVVGGRTPSDFALAQYVGGAPNDVRISDVTVTEGDAGSTNAVFTVSRTTPDTAADVRFETGDGTGSRAAKSADGDYVSSSGTLRFDAAEVTKTIAVAVNGDTKDEFDETFFVRLNDATVGEIADGDGTGTIRNDDVPPSVSVDDPTVVEGNTGTKKVRFTLTLSAPSGKTVTVDVATTDGTAVAPADYTSASASHVLEPGEVTAIQDVEVVADSMDEPDEAFFLNLSGQDNIANNVTIADAQGQATIFDDDGAPSLTVGDVTVDEGDTATFTITASHTSSEDITVDAATSDGSAAAGADYTALPKTEVTIPAGSTSVDVDVQTTEDTVGETDETFYFLTSDPTNAVIGDDGQATARIADDDGDPVLGIDNVTVAEGQAASFTVTASHPSSRDITFDVASADGTARAGSDYTALDANAVTIPAGQTSTTVGTSTTDDTTDEPDETFVVNVSNPQNASLGSSQGQATITDDDARPSLTITDVAKQEGDDATTKFVFLVRLSAASGKTVTVNYATGDGTAIAPRDYRAKSGTLTFVAGQVTKKIVVAVKGDTAVERNERFVVNLSGPTNVTIADRRAVATINNDD